MNKQIKITDIRLSPTGVIYCKVRDLDDGVLMESDIGHILSSIYNKHKFPSIEITNKKEILQTLGDLLCDQYKYLCS